MAHDFPYLKSGDELHPYHINEIYKELRRWRWATGDGGVIVDGANSATVSPVFRLGSVSRGDSTTYIQITGVADSTFGGYGWQEVAWRSALYLTDVGSGYLSTDTLTVNFSGSGISGYALPTATADPAPNAVAPDGGGVGVVNIVTPGHGLTSLSATITGGSGSGATLACILDGGALTGGGWVDVSGSAGAVGANDSHGNHTPGDLAYEASGNTSLGARIADSGGHYYHEATYPAVRNAGGRLLFFCSSSVLAKTKTISVYPSTANVFYGMEPLEITGSASPGGAGIAVEGTSALISGLGTTFYAYNFGTAVPTVGSYVVCGMVASAYGPFWAFRYDS